MQRRGTSLMEVLIAIFILALGLVSLLTLFPIGLVQMAKSVQDERAAELAGNAASYMRMLWKDACEASARTTPGGQPLFTDVTNANVMNVNSFWAAMDDPNLYQLDGDLSGLVVVPSPINDLNGMFPVPVTPTTGTNALLQAKQRLISQASRTGASYPVFVDPVGWEAAKGGTGNIQRDWLCYRANTAYAIPRRRIPSMVMNGTLVSANTTGQTLRNCMLLDDMTYDPDGVAKPNERQMQFSCAWLLRRDNNNKRTETNVTVVVYHKRSIESPSDEVAFHVAANNDTPGRATQPVVPSNIGTTTSPEFVFPNTITLVYTTPNRPPLRRGSWILDATMDQGQIQGVPAQVQGFYYRVADFTETENPPGTFQNVLQLETRLRPRQVEIAKLLNNALPQPQPRLIIVQDRVLEVFDKGPLEMNSPNRIN